LKHVIALMLVAGALAASGCQRKPNAAPVVALTDLAPDDVGRLDKQRALIQDLVTRRYQAAPLTRTRADLPVLQRLLDDHVFAQDQTYQLRSLGIVFGDVLANDLPLWWMLATDASASWPTLRYRDTTVLFDGFAMISKRMERGEKVDLAALLREAEATAAKLDRERRP
jgi:hypothetical protein